MSEFVWPARVLGAFVYISLFHSGMSEPWRLQGWLTITVKISPIIAANNERMLRRNSYCCTVLRTLRTYSCSSKVHLTQDVALPGTAVDQRVRRTGLVLMLVSLLAPGHDRGALGTSKVPGGHISLCDLTMC